MPDDDADFSTRVSAIKATLTRGWLAIGGTELVGSASRERQRYRGVWQKRFWEHVIVGDTDLARCEEYLWFNAVKHGLARCLHAWSWSTFHREVRAGRLRPDWRSICDGPPAPPPMDLPGAEIEDAAGE